MGVVQAPIQTVEEIYGLVWTSVANRQPIEAMYRDGIGCFVLTDWAGIGKDGFGSSAINTAAKDRADSSRQVPQQTGVVLCWRANMRMTVPVRSCDQGQRYSGGLLILSRMRHTYGTAPGRTSAPTPRWLCDPQRDRAQQSAPQRYGALSGNRRYHLTHVTMITGSNWRLRNSGGRHLFIRPPYQKVWSAVATHPLNGQFWG